MLYLYGVRGTLQGGGYSGSGRAVPFPSALSSSGVRVSALPRQRPVRRDLLVTGSVNQTCTGISSGSATKEPDSGSQLHRERQVGTRCTERYYFLLWLAEGSRSLNVAFRFICVTSNTKPTTVRRCRAPSKRLWRGDFAPPMRSSRIRHRGNQSVIGRCETSRGDKVIGGTSASLLSFIRPELTAAFMPRVIMSPSSCTSVTARMVPGTSAPKR